MFMDSDKYPTKVAEHIYIPAAFKNTRFPHILPAHDNLEAQRPPLRVRGHSPDCISQNAVRFLRYLICVKCNDQSLRTSGRWSCLHSPTSGAPKAADYHSHKQPRTGPAGHHFKARQGQERALASTSREAVRPEGRNSISQQALGGGRRGALCGM